MGKPEASQEMVDRARKVYEERLAAFPEATWGHALDHWLAHGDPAEALEMARKNHDNRPNGEAKLGLVQALHKAGQTAEAKALLEEVRASRYRSPEIDEIAAELEGA
jgi:thioredoxin-like negative regulator of GroEL